MGIETAASFGWASTDPSNLVNPQLEYFRKNRWILDFAGLPAPLTPGEKAILRINAKTAGRPKKGFEETKVDRLNGTIKLAGKPTYEDLQVVFYDAVKMKNIDARDIPDFSTSDIIERWIELIHQPAAGDAFGAVSNYKGYAYLHYLEPTLLVPGDESSGPGGNFEPIDPSTAISQTWLYQGLYPKSVDYGDGDYGSSDVQEVTVTFAYDRGYRIATKSALSA